VFSLEPLLEPPQTTTCVPVHTAVCLSRVRGAPVVDVAAQVSATGSYLPPVLVVPPTALVVPPQTIIRVPAHTAVGERRAVGAPVVDMAAQAFVAGSYRLPVLMGLEAKLFPPHTIMCVPVQTAVCWYRASGASSVVATHVSVAGS
jgi:hypothetical protein